MSNWIYGLIGATVVAIATWRIIRVRFRRRRRGSLRLSAVEIIVGNNRTDPEGNGITVARFLGGANGNVAPSSVFYTNNATALARDRDGNIYVASDIGNEILVYAPGTIGNPPPPRPSNTPPRLRNIWGPNTKLHRPTGIAVDGEGNLYVAERGGPSNLPAVLKFAPGADGDVAPIAVIPSQMVVAGEVAAVNTQLDIACGVAIDTYDASLYVVTCPEFQRGGASKLLRFDINTNGDVAPIAEITLGLSEPQQVILDGDGNIYVTNRGGNPSIAVYAASPVMDVAPTRTITSTDLSAPYGIAIDGADKIFVAEADPASVLVFDAGVSGNVAPLQKIQGPNAGLYNPLGIAVRMY